MQCRPSPSPPAAILAASCLTAGRGVTQPVFKLVSTPVHREQRWKDSSVSEDLALVEKKTTQRAHACNPALPVVLSSLGCGGTGSSSFAALVHEIQGRLSSVAIFTGEVRANFEPQHTAQLDERLARVSRVVAELQRIIEAVRRLDDGAAPSPVPIDLSALAATVAQRHLEREPSFGRAKILIQSNIGLSGDLGEIEIVLDNLIGNALKFSSRRAIPEIRITATAESNAVVVHISDNGVGIASEDSGRIFEPFTRCHPEFNGSGVGLALVRHIVARHGGRVWAAGEPGLGTTISFSTEAGPRKCLR